MIKPIHIKTLGLMSLLSSSLTMAQVSPGGISRDNVLWLRADQGVTLTGTNVQTWNNYSPNPILGNFSTQGAAINKPTHMPPTIMEVGINFNPYLIFNNTTTPNSISSANAVSAMDIMSANEVSIYQVMMLKNHTNTGVWLKWQHATNSYSGPRLGNETNPGSNPGNPRFDYKNNALYAGRNVTDQHILMTQEANTNEKSLRLEGATNATNVPNGTISTIAGTGRLTLGAEPYADDYPANVQIAEVIIYKSKLTAAERNKVESYLAVKYGFTLQQTGPEATNYTSSNNTVTWNNTANTGFHYNITGIGRDDESGLNQKQSKSLNNDALVTLYLNNTSTFPISNAANTNTFPSNQSFVLIGDNNAALTMGPCTNGNKSVRIERIWKAQGTGTPFVTTIAFSKSMLPAAAKELIVADDANFSTNVSYYPLSDDGTNLFAAATIHNKYFTVGTKPIEISFDAGLVCGSGTTQAEAIAINGVAPYTYQWQTNPVVNGPIITGITGGRYIVKVTHGNNCVVYDTVNILSNPSAITINSKVTEAICTTDNGTILLNCSGGTNPYRYSIDGINFSTNNQFTDLAPGNYTINVVDAIGCKQSTIVNITKKIENIDFGIEKGDAYCNANGLGGFIKINTVNGYYPLSFAVNNETSIYNIFENLGQGLYNIKITDKYGCIGDTAITLAEIPCCNYWTPNAFSPNGDGLNDIFAGVANTTIKDFQLHIFDRWGNKVFTSAKAEVGWDGIHQTSQKACDNGVYFYYIKYKCIMGDEYIEMKGEVNLIR